MPDADASGPARFSSGSALKRILVGRAVSSGRLEYTLLPKTLALPVFASDALSSVAYATGEIFIVLFAVSTDAKHLVMPISVAIAVLMTIVVTSYRQTVRAYPSGGGAYIVSKDNLGTLPGLIAAAALLVDYLMTVVVSIVAGVFAIGSAYPLANEHRVILSIGFVVLVTIANLRGARESGTLFAIPTYGFIVSILTLIVVGLIDCLNGCPMTEEVEPIADIAATTGPVSLYFILRAFSSGATALTGVEAISNGVPAFRRPQARNAASTLAIMGVIAVTMFLGISWLSVHVEGTIASDERSIPAQIAHAVFGGGIWFFVVQFFTAAILILAANTAYQDFPRLSSILARDRFMPRQFQNRGDRLVFSNGVLVLSALSCFVIYVFDADLSRLIQLYVVGVFTSFTLSQSGMVVHWLKERRKGREARGSRSEAEPSVARIRDSRSEAKPSVAPVRGWQRAIAINAFGAVTTAVVLVVVVIAKFSEGAWLSITAMAVLVPTFMSINRHYAAVAAELRGGSIAPGDVGANHVVLLVRDLDAATAEAVGFVRSFRPRDLRVLHPVPRGGVSFEVREAWRAFAAGLPDLEPLPTKGDDLLEPVRAYVRTIPRAEGDFVTVIVPEVVREGLFAYLLRRRELVRLKSGLLREPNVVVTDVPVVVKEGQPVGVDARPLIPQRTVTLVFVSGVHDATIRAVNYAQSLDAAETRAIYFDLDPDVAHSIEEMWVDQRLGVPLDIVEAPFRDLTGPILEEVRRFTAREDTVVSVVIPELVVHRWRHVLLHNQNALFVKRLMLFEPRVVLSSVPFVLGLPAQTEVRA